MKRLIITAALAAFLLFGFGCGPAAGDIFPMTVGSVWNMDALATVGPAVASLDTFQTGTVVVTAAEKATLATGEEVVKFTTDVTIHQRMPESTYTIATHSYYREDGGWILSYAALDDSTADTTLVANPSVGRTWRQGAATAEVVGQEEITVPAGNYRNAWKVKVTGSGNVMFYWYAAGVGMIRWYLESEELGVKWTNNAELTSATIK